jgi:hypothetical protein
MSVPQHPIAFDAGALTDPTDPAAVRAFAAETRARRRSAPSAGLIVGIIIAVAAVVIVVPVFVMVAVGFASIGQSPGGSLLPVALIGLGLTAAAVIAVLAWRRGRETRYRLHRFAQANGLTYEPRITAPALPGMIFSLGHSRVSTDVLRGTTPRFVEFGNYQYTVRSGKNSVTHRWGYVAVKLDVPLPNIVLDAVGNNGFGSNLPASFQKEQRLSLEGDFDQHFTLYCPAGYEQDALYLFTPDIMARFIDNAAQLDVEIVDDWMFLYTPRKASTLDAATWAWLFGAVGALMTKFDQWARWRDDRLHANHPTAGFIASGSASAELPFAPPAGLLTPPPGVAQQGRRLKRTSTWVPIVFLIVFGTLWFWSRLN